MNHDLITMPCLLISIKSLKNSSTNKPEFNGKIIGSVGKIYTFQKIADFQYLPMNSSLSNFPIPKQPRKNDTEYIDGIFLFIHFLTN